MIVVNYSLHDHDPETAPEHHTTPRLDSVCIPVIL
jgi:hypothetical protein